MATQVVLDINMLILFICEKIPGLHSAVEGDQVEVVKLLVEAGADIDATNRSEINQLIYLNSDHIPFPN